MKGINPIAAQIANSPATKLGAKLASSPAAKAAMQMTNNPMVKAATQISRIARPYAEALQKLSHIEWIGKIPKHWDMCRIKNWASFINGFAFKSDELTTDKPVPVIRISDIQNSNLDYTSCLTVDYSNKLQTYLAKHNDIIIAMSGATTGKTALVKSDTLAYINQRVGIIRNAEKYIYYCLNTDMFSEYVNLLSAGSAQPNISMGQILNFAIPYIPKEKQQAIADYLDGECARIDGIVTTQRQIIERLKEYKKSVITEAVTRGLNPDAPMKDSGIEWIGKIPEHWEVKKIKYLFQLRDERNYLPLEQVNLISLYTDKGVLQHADIEETTGNKAQNADGYKLVYEGDIIVNIILCWMGAIGFSAYNGVTSPAYDIYKPLPKTNSKYYHYLFRTSLFSGECYKVGRGIMLMRWRTYSDQFKSIYVSVPPIEEQQEIADYLDRKCSEIDSIIEKRERMIELMTEYKKSLIYECVTGKKEIVDVVE